MDPLSAASKLALHAAYTASLPDAGKILKYNAGSTNALGLPNSLHEDTLDAVPCGLRYGGNREVQEGGETVVADAVLRLPYGTPIDHKDRFTLTHKTGDPLAVPQTFEVIGVPQVGPAGTVCLLKYVQS